MDAPTETPSDYAVLLRQFLATRDVPCPVCGYNLRDCQSPMCSECGAKLDLRIGSLDLKIGPWLVALLGTALPMGAVTLIALGMFFMTRRFLDPNALRVLVAFIGLIILYGAVIHFLVQKRRAFWSKQRAKQWRIVGFILLLNVVAFIGAILLPSFFR
jgi:hypothetical protein